VYEAKVDQRFHKDQELAKGCLYELKTILQVELGVVRFKYEFISGKDIKLRIVTLVDSFSPKDISDLADCCIRQNTPLVMVSVQPWKVTGGGGFEVDCVTGDSVPYIIENGNVLLTKAYEVKDILEDKNAPDRRDRCTKLLKEIEVILGELKRELPHWASAEAKQVLSTATKQLEKEWEAEKLEVLKQRVKDCEEPVVVQVFECEKELRSLQKLTQAAKDRPVMILVCSNDDIIQGRCVLPPVRFKFQRFIIIFLCILSIYGI